MTQLQNRVALRLTRADFDLSVDLSFPERGITVLSGPSGSGKTTVLRCVAGLERDAHGVVSIQSNVWQDSDASAFLPTWKRPIGYVFQEASLFEHLNVRENLEFGVTRVRATSARKALNDAVQLLGIQALTKRRPDELSGGERQRVAIARALATQPKLLLLDEPLSALDPARRQEIYPWLERIRDELGTPMLYVTHSVDEIARLADHVVVMNRGRIVSSGPTAQVFAAVNSPVSIGDDVSVLIDGLIAAHDQQWNLMRVDFEGGTLWVNDSGLALGKHVRVRVLAKDVSITLAEPVNTSIQNHLPGIVESIPENPHPSQALVRIQCDQTLILSRVTRKSIALLGLQAGTRVWVQVKAVAVIS